MTSKVKSSVKKANVNGTTVAQNQVNLEDNKHIEKEDVAQKTSAKNTKVESEEVRSYKSSLVLGKTIVHSRRVEVFADTLFKALQPVHELPRNAHKILSIAATLHDIGWIYGQEGHHKHSAKIIYNYVKYKKFVPEDDSIDTSLQKEVTSLLAKNLEKVDKETARVIACVARYHRKGMPLNRHSMYSKLSKENKLIVRKLASILRIADALDYSHLALVKNVKVKIEDKEVLLILECENSCSAEKTRVDVKKQLFQETFKMILEAKVVKKTKEK